MTTKSERRFRVTRDVTREECPWLDRKIKAGRILYEYLGDTYGCITSSGTACTVRLGVTPFFEVPTSAIEEEATL